MALVAVPARHPHELEAVTGLVVRRRQPRAELLDLRDGQLEQLRQQVRRHGVHRHEDDGLDGPHDVDRRLRPRGDAALIRFPLVERRFGAHDQPS
jgi:hypothetical protein